MLSQLAFFVRLVAFLTLLNSFFSFADAAATPLAYKISQDVKGEGFLDAFNFESISDPTHGRVNYVNRETALRNNYTFGAGETFILRPDTVNVLKPDGPGRDSVRLISKQNYRNHVAVFDIRHMPQGCGTWPAVWEVDPTNWPNGGELDILEGANDNGPNAATLHTSPGCTMPSARGGMLGKQVEENCDANINNNVGCPVKFDSDLSYGPKFNNNGGGWYAIERSPAGIKVWFWSRNDPNTPHEICGGLQNVRPDTWGTPNAFFPDNTCSMEKHFGSHNIVINLTLCGDWAGNTFGIDGCPGNCVDLVNNSPEAFQNAYFDFASMRVYTP
ncbi:endo-1,3(4)-beta-glucanase [Coprinellus micaceus]|uniref:Endo-1,3(4)-beta-glucanase n=1 Tax=Coprinellus micaceus TaxID=71717 RepID=A0A4Y7SS51_COPMI|nr:endo-1,3(4)-beta-glucanase [Coprinellus micaceus]